VGKYANVTLGCDPELFFKDKATGNPVSAVGLIGGSKEKPKKIDKRGHAVLEDNVMVEFNTPPAKTPKAFIGSISHVLGYLAQTFPQMELDISASRTFPKDQLKHPQSRVFGCDPDYDAWNMVINPPPNPNTDLRTCGGHIHVGYDNPDIDNQVELIRAMDLFIGVPAIVIDPDTERKARYGKAGAFRPKEYGAEYRVPSNFWIKNPQLIQWVWDNTHKAIAFLNEGKKIPEELGKRIQHTINKADMDTAKALSKEYGSLQGV
jgi:hypothetical protein